jgi:tRNA-2-methylthio-N6-dimethylallyladenosine synthase
MGNDLIQIGNAPSPGGVSMAEAPALDFAALPALAGDGKTFYLETFGCQMNVHDSEKVAGVLMARGYRPVDTHQDADVILYNTCSIREKAAQKVFSRLGAFRKGRGNEEKIIAVLGCVAQQEGERFFERAPQVSLVCGSASYPQLPELLAQIESGNAA